MRILMVCLGNICRSPLAEGILQHKIAERGLPWTVDSAGTGHWHVGTQPDKRSIAVAKQYGIDIGQQRARQFQVADFEQFDKILVMDTQNQRDVLRLAQKPEHHDKVTLILDHANPGLHESVPDPYHDDDGFGHVFQLLDHACEQFLERTAAAT